MRRTKKQGTGLLVGVVNVSGGTKPPKVSLLTFASPARMSAEVGTPVTPLSWTAFSNSRPAAQASVAVSGRSEVVRFRFAAAIAALKSAFAGTLANQGRSAGEPKALLNSGLPRYLFEIASPGMIHAG